MTEEKTEAPETADVPSQETQPEKEQAAGESDVKPEDSKVTLSKEEYEALLSAKGRASKEAKDKLKLEKEMEELRKKAGDTEQVDPEKQDLMDKLKRSEQELLSERLSRKVEEKLASADLPESTKKLIRNKAIALIDEEEKYSIKSAELSLVEMIDDLEKDEKLKKLEESKKPTAPEFTPGTDSAPPPPASGDAYEKAKKDGNIAEMIKAKLFG